MKATSKTDLKKIKHKKTTYRNYYEPMDSYKMFLTVIISTLAGSIGLVLLLSTIGGLLGTSYEEIAASNPGEVLLMLFGPILFFLIFVLFNDLKRIEYKNAIGIKKEINWKIVIISLALALVTLFFFAPLVNLLTHWLNLWGYKPDNELGYNMDNWWRLIIAIISLGVLPAITEEFIFRGVIFKGLLDRYTPILAITLTTVFFVLMHGSLQQTVYQFLLGGVLCIIAYVTGNILYPILAHMINNIVVVVFTYFEIKTPIVMEVFDYSNAFHYILPFLLLICGVGIIIGLIILLKKCTGPVKEEEKILNGEIKQSLNKKIGFMDFNKATLRDEKMIFWVGIVLSIIIWVVYSSADFVA